jgi:hypothetical protein
MVSDLIDLSLARAGCGPILSAHGHGKMPWNLRIPWGPVNLVGHSRHLHVCLDVYGTSPLTRFRVSVVLRRCVRRGESCLEPSSSSHKVHACPPTPPQEDNAPAPRRKRVVDACDDHSHGHAHTHTQAADMSWDDVVAMLVEGDPLFQDEAARPWWAVDCWEDMGCANAFFNAPQPEPAAAMMHERDWGVNHPFVAGVGRQ